jgi:hypothetical protein
VATVLRPLAGDDLDRLFVWENDDRAVRMAAFTRADSSDRRSFDAYHASGTTRTTRSLRSRTTVSSWGWSGAFRPRWAAK